MSTPKTPGRRRRAVRQVLWLVIWAWAIYGVSLLLIIAVIIFAPATSWARAFKIVGLSLNVAGAIVALSPRILRTTESIERDLSLAYGREDRRRDTIIARWGLTLLAIGFIQQLVGNFLG